MLLHTLFVAALVLAGATAAQPSSSSTPADPAQPTEAPHHPDWRHNRPSPPPGKVPTNTSALRLSGKRFPYDQLPFQADTAETERGVQVGYNQCNASTAGPNSRCQTLVVNSVSDFCLWIPQKLSPVGNAEAGMVAACTDAASSYHGARPIPPGALTGVQFYKTPSYVAVAGTIDQTLLNIPARDFGGEEDSGAQDARGNPIGGLAYSINLPGHEGKMTQSISWTLFIGSNTFCLKLCSPTAANAANLCEHVYDTVGCNVNFPANIQKDVFESCAADDMHPPGEFVELSTIIPFASSSCTTYQSAVIYATTTASSTTTGTSGPPTTTHGGGPSQTPKPDAALPRAAGAIGFVALLPVVAGLVGAILV